MIAVGAALFGILAALAAPVSMTFDLCATDPKGVGEVGIIGAEADWSET